jgi:O-antigen ligase
LLGSLSRSGDQKELTNLTGRTDLWRFAWGAIEQAPVAGYGFGCSRFVMKESPDFPTGHAHNVLLNVMLQSGLVGVGCMFGMLLQLTMLMFRSPSVFADVMTVFLLVGGVAESIIFGPIPSTFTILWLMAVCWRSALPQDAFAGASHVGATEKSS